MRNPPVRYKAIRETSIHLSKIETLAAYYVAFLLGAQDYRMAIGIFLLCMVLNDVSSRVYWWLIEHNGQKE